MISSSANAQIKYLAKLQEKGAARREDKVYVCEGRKMFAEVVQCARESIVKAYFSESFYIQYVKKKGYYDQPGLQPEVLSTIPFEIVSDLVFKEVSQTITPQGILAIVRQPEYSLEALINGTHPELPDSESQRGQEQSGAVHKPPETGRDAARILLLENLRDPGNLGTILRTAEGAGMAGVILSRESVDMFNPKVIRSTMGAIYRVPFVYAEDFAALPAQLRERGFTVYAAHLEGSVEYDTVSYPARTALMIGNEANGLTKEAADAADARIRIPMEGALESLNAAVAAAVLMYETYRQARRK